MGLTWGKKRRELPRVMSQALAIAILKEHGWEQTRGGKHVVKMEKQGERPITLPMHKGADYGPSLTSRILQQAGLKQSGE